MNYLRTFLLIGIGILCCLPVQADQTILKNHCAQCHSGPRPKGDFSIHDLGEAPTMDSADYWTGSLERVEAGDMPPAKHNNMTDQERGQLVRFLSEQVKLYESRVTPQTRAPPRRMSNREFINSVRDVLLLEHIGSHDPTSTLLGDTLHDGFDTHGDTLSLSEYHLEQYVTSVCRVLDGAILDGPRPESKTRHFRPHDFAILNPLRRNRADNTKRSARGVEVIGTQFQLHLPDFDTVPTTGRYRIRIRATGVDHHVYSQDDTGIYRDDPIVLRVTMGAKHTDINLPEESMRGPPLFPGLIAASV